MVPAGASTMPLASATPQQAVATPEPAITTTTTTPVPAGEPQAEHPATARYHEHILSMYRAQADSMGKHLVLLSGGALTLSITYLDKITGPHPAHRIVLILGWVSLLLCLVTTLFSMYKSSWAMLAAQVEYPFLEQKELGGPHAKWVVWLNRIAVISLGVGLFLLALFALLNPK